MPSSSTAQQTARDTVLEISGLKTYFHTSSGIVRAVDGIDLKIERGRMLGLVGESGCGKSVTALSILKLLPTPPAEIVGGKVLYGGRNLISEPIAEMRKVRGSSIAMIFQEPMTSLNPVFTIGDQITEAILTHKKISKSEARDEATRLLDEVGIPEPRRRLSEYPHSLSGGMRQRVMIAMALSCGPEILIADEPTTALDVTIAAQILELLSQLRTDRGMSVLFITHDLGIVAEYADDAAVMYAGRIVERAGADQLFASPLHHYTRGLIDSLPNMNAGERERLATIPGVVPDLTQKIKGCAFADRCSAARDDCRASDIELVEAKAGRAVACIHPLAPTETG